MIAQRAELETFRLSFETLTGTAEEGAKALQNALNFKANSNYSLQSINEATQSLVQFGMNAGEANLMLGTLGDLALGDSSKLQTLSKIMGKVYAKGEADVEMKQVLNNIKAMGDNLQNATKGVGEIKPKLNKSAMNEVTKQVGTWSQKLQNMVNVSLATP
ncbi:hypothetical protein, partial [Treponema sp. R6D11]